MLDERSRKKKRKKKRKEKKKKKKNMHQKKHHQQNQHPLFSSSDPSAPGSCATVCGEGSAALFPTRRWVRRRKPASGWTSGWDRMRQRRRRSILCVRLQRRACRVLLLGLLHDGHQEMIGLFEAIVLAARREMKEFLIAPEIQCASTGG